MISLIIIGIIIQIVGVFILGYMIFLNYPKVIDSYYNYIPLVGLLILILGMVI